MWFHLRCSKNTNTLVSMEARGSKAEAGERASKSNTSMITQFLATFKRDFPEINFNP